MTFLDEKLKKMHVPSQEFQNKEESWIKVVILRLKYCINAAGEAVL
jgi:hypothetical protein